MIAACLLASGYSFAGIDDQMRDTFNMLTNTTNPNAYNTARRGVISGGSLFMKAPIKRTNIVSATAPSFSAGCGGISLYGGSFSFINKDEFIQTFQAIGANALGYGVKLALQSACPTCEQVMTSLEKTAQFINDMNIDSCQAAQGIVDAGAEFATTANLDAFAKNYGVNSGKWDDMNQAWGWANESGTSPTKEIEKHSPTVVKEKMTINATWKAMKESKINALYGGDDEFLELLMTMIGTVVVKNPSSDSESDPKPIIYPGKAITLNNLIDGGTFNIYECDTTDSTGCLNASLSPSKSITLKGFRDRVHEALLGGDGLVVAYQLDADWSTNAKKTLKFPTLVGQVCTDKIYKAAVNGQIETVGKYVADICSERMALELAYVQVSSYIQSAEAALKNLFTSEGQKSAKEEAEKLLEKSRKRYFEEYQQLESTASFEDIKSKLDSVKFNDGDSQTVTGR